MHNTVYAAYRLRTRDLAAPFSARIRRVTYEGVERLRPVVHFDGVPKPLVLSGEQGRTLMRLTGESLCERWVGHRVTLSPDGEEITLLPVDIDAAPPQPSRPRPSRSLRRLLAMVENYSTLVRSQTAR